MGLVDTESSFFARSRKKPGGRVSESFRGMLAIRSSGGGGGGRDGEGGVGGVGVEWSLVGLKLRRRGRNWTSF